MQKSFAYFVRCSIMNLSPPSSLGMDSARGTLCSELFFARRILGTFMVRCKMTSPLNSRNIGATNKSIALGEETGNPHRDRVRVFFRPFAGFSEPPSRAIERLGRWSAPQWSSPIPAMQGQTLLRKTAVPLPICRLCRVFAGDIVRHDPAEREFRAINYGST